MTAQRCRHTGGLALLKHFIDTIHPGNDHTLQPTCSTQLPATLHDMRKLLSVCVARFPFAAFSRLSRCDSSYCAI